MAVSIKNVEKFLDDHPDITEARRKEIMAGAQKANENGIIAGGAVEGFMDNLTVRFFREVENNFDHLRIALEDLSKFAESCKS